MARSRKRLVYLEPDLDAQIVTRAEALGLSVNEWMHRVFLHALASKGQSVKITETTEVRL